MFWIVLMLDHLINKAGSSFLASRDDRRSKKEWKALHDRGEWESATWIDHLGVERSLVDNSICKTTRRNGDRVLLDQYGHVIRNYSGEARHKEYNDLKADPKPFKTVVKWDTKDRSFELKNPARGARYKDIKTGRFYVQRRLVSGSRSCDFYMDAETGEYIRPTDSMIEMWHGFGEGMVDEYSAKANEILKEHLEYKKYWTDKGYKDNNTMFDNTLLI